MVADAGAAIKTHKWHGVRALKCRGRVSPPMARKKLTATFVIPMPAMPGTASQNGQIVKTEGPRDAVAAAGILEDNVTCRMSNGTPAKAASSGIKPSIKPNEIFPANPAMFFDQKRPNRSARLVPNARTNRRSVSKATPTPLRRARRAVAMPHFVQQNGQSKFLRGPA